MVRELGLDQLSPEEMKNKIGKALLSPHSEHVSELANELDLWSKKKSE